MKREKHKLLLYYSILLELIFYPLKAFKAVSIKYTINLFCIILLTKTTRHTT